MGAYGSPELLPKQPQKEKVYREEAYRSYKPPKADISAESVVRVILWIVIIGLLLFVFGLLFVAFRAVL
jgi:hypothetical protein